ncbi:hypothetical protein ISCGN_003319 [Ixodes scapularis]
MPLAPEILHSTNFASFSALSVNQFLQQIWQQPGTSVAGPPKRHGRDPSQLASLTTELGQRLDISAATPKAGGLFGLALGTARYKCGYKGGLRGVVRRIRRSVGHSVRQVLRMTWRSVLARVCSRQTGRPPPSPVRSSRRGRPRDRASPGGRAAQRKGVLLEARRCKASTREVDRRYFASPPI